MRWIVAVFVLCVCAAVAAPMMAAQKSAPKIKDGTLETREEDGGSVAMHTASGMVNQESSLRRRWCVIDDTNAPAGLDHAGVWPRYDEQEKVQFLMSAGMVSPRQAISAIEVRYVMFDVWGQHLRTVALTRLVDSSTHVDLRTNTTWPALDSEVSQLVTVVAFVSRVRTADGEVWEFDPKRIAARMEAFGVTALPADLTPDDLRMVHPGVIYWTYSSKQDDAGVRATGVVRP